MIRIALGQLEVIPGRPDLNSAAMMQMIQEARDQRADMIVFPEMAIPGYLLGDSWEQAAFLRDCEYYGQQIVAASDEITILFGNVAVDWTKQGDDGRVRKYNAFFAAQQGKLAGADNFPYPFRIKTLHPNYREFDDSRHFFSSRKLAAELATTPDQLLQPINLTIGGKVLSVGCILCEDGWSDDYFTKPIDILSQNHSLDLLVNISSSPFTLGKNNKRNRVFSKQARDIAVPLIYVNNVGLQNNGKTVYTFDGCSSVYSPSGEIAAYCSPFTAQVQTVAVSLTTDFPHLTSPAITKDNTIDRLFEAINYGTKKFLQSIGMNRVVIGVSGGIDSAVAAALYTHVLGPENVLLVNMPSRYNSETTKGLAAKLAENLGCRYVVVPIQQSVELTLSQIASAPLLNPRTGEESTLTVTGFMAENIQARDRSSRVLAGLAAAFGGGFTCNANKCELTVGYSTLYGDQAGFLAALADLWKHQVYELAHYFNTTVYRQEVIPAQTITIVPSAELSFDQSVDEGKGDPLIYPYHDYLFRAFMEYWNRATPEDILLWYQAGVLEEKLGCAPHLVKQLFATPAAFIEDLERWWKLYTGLAVAKRIQAPPVLAVSRRAYGFDHREAQNSPYFTKRYQELKSELLRGDANV